MVKANRIAFVFLSIAFFGLFISFVSAEKNGLTERLTIGNVNSENFLDFEEGEVVSNYIPGVFPNPNLICRAAANNFLMLCLEWIEGGYEWQCSRDAFTTWCSCRGDWGLSVPGVCYNA